MPSNQTMFSELDSRNHDCECVYCGCWFLGTGDDCGGCSLEGSDLDLYERRHGDHDAE